MAVSMMKDEAPFLLEWIAHHLAVGFTDILVYTNDCSDGTDTMLMRLEELGLAHHRRNLIPDGVKPQPSALNHAQNEPLVGASDWVLVLDADEFLSVNHPSGQLEGMLDDAVARGANGVVITWRIFGSGGVIDWSRAPVTETYTRAAPPLWNKGWGVKTLFKFDPEYWKLGIHRPTIKTRLLKTGFPDTIRWLNGAGQPMEDYFRFRGWRSIRRTLGYDWAQMNHYAVKSLDAYALRRLRGNVNNKTDKYNADYWSLQNRNEVEDRAILRHAPARARIMAELLGDPVLNRLHHGACEAIEARLATYRQTEAYQRLRDSLIAASQVPITRVQARPPKARDPARIAALMSAVEKQASARPKPDRRTPTVTGWAVDDGDPYLPPPHDLSGDMPCDWVVNHDVALPADARVLRPEALAAVLAGRFERRNARNITSYLEGCARVLDIGVGIGFIPIQAVRKSQTLIVMAQDQRAALIAMGQTIARRDGGAHDARLKWVDGPLRLPGDAGDSAGGLAAYLRDFRPAALRISRPRDLPPAMLAGQTLRSLRRVIVPFASDAQADELRAGYGPVLAQMGFAEIPARAAAGSLQFDKTTS